MYNGLAALAEKYPHEIQNLRGKGRGTFIAWDSPRRDAFLKLMKTAGVNIGGSGETAVRLRPMLVFQKHHGGWLSLSCIFKPELIIWFLNSYNTAREGGGGSQGINSADVDFGLY